MEKPLFRDDNTRGYNKEQLYDLNQGWNEAKTHIPKILQQPAEVGVKLLITFDKWARSEIFFYAVAAIIACGGLVLTYGFFVVLTNLFCI